MKKLFLALCLVLSVGTLSHANDSSFDPDPYTMVASLQRVIATSTVTKDIIEAERLIRDVYGPACDRLFWSRLKFAAKAAGVVAVGAIVLGAIVSTSK